MRREARISECGRYRYSLTRQWSESPRRVVFVMLNPSTADGTVDDPTIRRCTSFAIGQAAGSLEVVNLYAYRATDPRELLTARRNGLDVIGPDNDEAISAALSRADRVVAAWGARATTPSPPIEGRIASVVRMIEASPARRAYCLGVTRGGAPRHPLYISQATPLVAWVAP